MKILLKQAVAIISATLIIASCGNSIDRDAKKLAEIQCKTQRLEQKRQKLLQQAMSSGDNMSALSAMSLSPQEMEKLSLLALEADSLFKEIERKYTSDSDKEKLRIALLKEMAKCGSEEMSDEEANSNAKTEETSENELTKNNEQVYSTEQSNATNNTEEEMEAYYTVASDKAYFYNAPSNETKRKAYLIEGDRVLVTKTQNEFGYAEFENSQGKTTSGWIKLSDIEREITPGERVESLNETQGQ
ncbi:MAG: hypothetical protein KF900_06620 [Bacteroidetes bacterium]|nr:hypothetical protein [Bacteroidota bacterium]